MIAVDCMKITLITNLKVPLHYKAASKLPLKQRLKIIEEQSQKLC